MLQIKGLFFAGALLLSALIGGGAAVGVIRATKPTIEVVNKEVVLKCPEVKPCNGIDYDKIKNVRGLTINNSQYLTVDGDSVLTSAIIAGLRAELERLKISRCR